MENIVIASLQVEVEIKKILCNTVQEGTTCDFERNKKIKHWMTILLWK